jgi:hypothetical protein
MTIEAFAEMTRRVIARDGFDDFLPTACYPGRNVVAVLEGVPAGIDVEQAALRWAARKAEADEEYLVAFKSSPDRFKIIRRVGGESEEANFAIAAA